MAMGATGGYWALVIAMVAVQVARLLVNGRLLPEHASQRSGSLDQTS